MNKQGVSLIGAPTDIGADMLGARMGPEVLRLAGIAEAIAHFGFAVSNCGNVARASQPRSASHQRLPPSA